MLTFKKKHIFHIAWHKNPLSFIGLYNSDTQLLKSSVLFVKPNKECASNFCIVTGRYKIESCSHLTRNWETIKDIYRKMCPLPLASILNILSKALFTKLNSAESSEERKKPWYAYPWNANIKAEKQRKISRTTQKVYYPQHLIINNITCIFDNY